MGHILTFEFPPSLLVVALPATAIIVLNTVGSAKKGSTNQTAHVAYQGSLHVTTDHFTDTLREKDSQDYREKEDKYGHMVS